MYWQQHRDKVTQTGGEFLLLSLPVLPTISRDQEMAASKARKIIISLSKAVYGTSWNFLVLIVVDNSCVMRWTILKGSRGSGPEQGAGGTQAGLMVIIFCVSAFMESKHCVRTSPGCCWVEADHKMTDMFWSCNLHQHHLHLYTLISGIFVCLEHAKPIYTLSIQGVAKRLLNFVSLSVTHF